MDPATILALSAAIGPLLGGLFGGGGGSSSSNRVSTQTTDPNLRRMLELQRGRLEGSEDLYRAVMGMAMGLLPTQYQRRTPMNIQLPQSYYGGGPGAGRGSYTPNFSDGSGGMGGGEVMSDGRTATGDSDFLQKLI